MNFADRLAAAVVRKGTSLCVGLDPRIDLLPPELVTGLKAGPAGRARAYERFCMALIFDNHGVPLWWIHAPVWNPKVLEGGNVLWLDDSGSGGGWGVHRLDGSLIRTPNPVGVDPNPHDLQILPNGDYLAGSTIKRSHVDTSAYGGSSDANVLNTELQQVSLDGRAPTGLEEPGPYLAGRNRASLAVGHQEPLRHRALELDRARRKLGDRLVPASRCRLQDPKSTGNIVWKLGGTKTPKS